MVWGATLGLPLSLVGVGAVLGLNKQKLTEGKDLIRYFCVPCNPTKVNGGRTRNLPHHAPTKWSAFKTYNSRDVEVEIAIQGKLSNFPVLDSVWKEYWLDQEINDRGIEIDKDFVEAAVQLDELSKAGLNQQLQELTGLENPNSVLQMRGWLLDHGLETESLGKKAVDELLEQPIDENLKQVLVLRQQLAKSSVKKYQAMQNFACSDNRSRGLFQFYGANRTGRFAGRGIHLQNLPQNHMSDLSEARSLVKQSNFEMLNILYGNVPNVLSELLRTAFVPREGMKFIVSDFSAIEARVIAWLSGEKWRQEVFKNGGDIYCASASQMFGVPVEKHGVNGLTGRLEELDSKLKELESEIISMAIGGQGYDELASQIFSLRDERDAVAKQIAANTNLQQRVDEMVVFVKEHDVINEYSEVLVRRLIEKVTIFEKNIVVDFKSGVRVTVEI